MPHLHIPQLAAKKNISIIVIINIDICDSRFTNRETVTITVSVAYIPLTNAPDDREVVELQVLLLKTYVQK